jgi:hypothetical protein
MVMGPETKNKHAGEDQQQSTGLDWTMSSSQVARSKGGVTSSSRTPPPRRSGGTMSKHGKVWKEQKYGYGS